MQEEIEHKTVNLAISTTKLSARTLLRGMQFLLRQYDKHASQGKQSMKRLVRQNRGVTNIHCHHKRPKSLGGTDCYGNLVLVLAPVHELIHATNKSAIDSRLSVLKLNRQQLAKLNRLRISAEVKPIDSEEIALELNSHNGMTKEIKKTV